MDWALEDNQAHTSNDAADLDWMAEEARETRSPEGNSDWQGETVHQDKANVLLTTTGC